MNLSEQRVLHPCVAQKGKCRYGDDCKFAKLSANACLFHLQHQINPTKPTCRFGSNCRFKHIELNSTHCITDCSQEIKDDYFGDLPVASNNPETLNQYDMFRKIFDVWFNASNIFNGTCLPHITTKQLIQISFKYYARYQGVLCAYTQYEDIGDDEDPIWELWHSWIIDSDGTVYSSKSQQFFDDIMSGNIENAMQHKLAQYEKSRDELVKRGVETLTLTQITHLKDTPEFKWDWLHIIDQRVRVSLFEKKLSSKQIGKLSSYLMGYQRGIEQKYRRFHNQRSCNFLNNGREIAKFYGEEVIEDDGEFIIVQSETIWKQLCHFLTTELNYNLRFYPL